MAAVTSPIMLMSQNINDRFENLNIFVYENFLVHTFNVLWLVTILK